MKVIHSLVHNPLHMPVDSLSKFPNQEKYPIGRSLNPQS
jgi:hypothetical protein